MQRSAPAPQCSNLDVLLDLAKIAGVVTGCAKAGPPLLQAIALRRLIFFAGTARSSPRKEEFDVWFWLLVRDGVEEVSGLGHATGPGRGDFDLRGELMGDLLHLEYAIAPDRYGKSEYLVFDRRTWRLSKGGFRGTDRGSCTTGGLKIRRLTKWELIFSKALRWHLFRRN
jgi:hypothetical protein